MKKRILLTAFVIAVAASMSLTSHAEESRAEKIEKMAQDVYRQLITERKLEATFESDFEFAMEDSEALAEQLFAYMDDPEELFDGETLRLNMQMDWQSSGIVKNGKYYYTLSGGSTAYDINEADELTDHMAEEILAECIPDADDIEKLCRMAHYLWNHYSYNHAYMDESSRKGEEEAKPLYNSIVKAYYEEPHTITCNGFANLAYVVGRKIGLECEYLHGKKHVYNCVRINGSNELVAVDITAGSIIGIPINRISGKTASYKVENDFEKQLNERKKYRPARMTEVFSIAAFNIQTYGTPSPYGRIGRLLDLLMLLVSTLTVIVIAIAVHVHRKKIKRPKDQTWIKKKTIKDLPI